MSVLYTTHYLDEAERLCDTVSVLERGKILITSSPSRLIAESDLGSTVLLPLTLHQADTVTSIYGENAVRITPDGLEIRTKDTAQLFATLAQQNIDASNAQVHDGRLENVYLQLTGKDYVA